MEFAGRFQAVLAHTRDICTRQMAELFIGGLPDHIRVDVEMHDPGDLQTAMYLARAFERKASALAAPAQRGARPPQRPTTSAHPPAGGGPPATAPMPTAPTPTGTTTPARTFRRLTPAEMLERRRQGLCYNCDEQYVRSHVCPHVFYLESSDYIDDDVFTTTEDAAVESPMAPPDGAAAHALVVFVYALAGIRTYHTMLLPITINGERLLALLDTGSTHTFLQGTVMRCLGLVSHGGNNLCVTVANGERLPCEGIARDVLVLIGGESFPVTCVGLALGCFDFIIGVDFLGLWGLFCGTSRASPSPSSEATSASRGSAWVLRVLLHTSRAWPRPRPTSSGHCWTNSYSSTGPSSTSLVGSRPCAPTTTASTYQGPRR